MKPNLCLVAVAMVLLPAGAFGMTMEMPPQPLGGTPPAVTPSVPPHALREHMIKPTPSYRPDNPTSRSATEALNLLESQGYATFTNFHQVGSQFVAEETQSGHTWQLTIDPATKTVTKLKRN